MLDRWPIFPRKPLRHPIGWPWSARSTGEITCLTADWTVFKHFQLTHYPEIGWSCNSPIWMIDSNYAVQA